MGVGHDRGRVRHGAGITRHRGTAPLWFIYSITLTGILANV
ncbi:MAG: hypothetical protein R2699_08170 [Acidimicrobiales bacterium]